MTEKLPLLISATDKRREHDRFDEALTQCVNVLDAEGYNLPAAVRFEWNRRFTSRAADAWVWPKWSRELPLVRVGEKLVRHFTEEARWHLYVHELCHVFANYHFDRSCGHGPLWKRTMSLCGSPPETYYSPKDLIDPHAFYRNVRGAATFDCYNPVCDNVLRFSSKKGRGYVEIGCGLECRKCGHQHNARALEAALLASGAPERPEKETA